MTNSNHPKTAPITAIPKVVTSNITQMKRYGRVVLLLWYCLIALTTFTSARILLSQSIHPLYLVLSLLLPSTVFLVLSFFSFNGLLAKLVSLFKHALEKYTIATPPPLTAGNSMDTAWLPYFIRFLSHSTWGIIFATLIISFFISFTFKEYTFYLGTTLFSHQVNFYDRWINGLDALPKIIGILPLNESLIHNTLQNSLNELERGLWAKWILLMLTIYGLIPRIVCSLYYCIRLYLIAGTRPKNAPEPQPQVIDKACEQPRVIRPPKTLRSGSGSHIIALDFKEATFNHPPIHYLNDIEGFSQFEAQLQVQPALQLTIIIDGQQTPDRGTLRRIIRLLNLTMSTKIYCFAQSEQEARFSLWKAALLPLLLENELFYQQLEALEFT